MNSFSRFTTNEQWGHVYVEIGRAKNWDKKHNTHHVTSCLGRVLNMLDDMVQDHLEKKKNIKEILRVRDGVAELYMRVPRPVLSYEHIEHFCLPFVKVARSGY